MENFDTDLFFVHPIPQGFFPILNKKRKKNENEVDFCVHYLTP